LIFSKIIFDRPYRRCAQWMARNGEKREEKRMGGDTLLTLVGIFGASFAVAFSGALMPGPLLAVTVREAAARGFWAGPILIAGHAILECALVALLLVGLGALLATDAAFGVIGAAGALVMLWMAYGMFRALPELRISSGDGTSSGMHPVLAGIVMSVANPYWSIWWATIGLGYITYSMREGALGVASFFTGHILADLAWYSFVAFGIARGRRFIGDRAYRALIGVCAVALVVFALWFGLAGARRLMALAL